MIPSDVKRDKKTPYRTRRLANGTIVVLDAYEGTYDQAEGRVSINIKGLKVDVPVDAQGKEEKIYPEEGSR
jgi:hypothetical protein